MQGAEDEGKVHAGHQGPTEAEGSVLTYVTEAEFRKQRSRSPSCNSLLIWLLPLGDHLSKMVWPSEKNSR